MGSNGGELKIALDNVKLNKKLLVDYADNVKEFEYDKVSANL